MQASVIVRRYIIESDSPDKALFLGYQKISHLILNKKLRNVSFKIEKDKNCENEFIFTVYTNIDLNKSQKSFCVTCREFHKSFFINENFNCNRCNLKTFLQRQEQSLKIQNDYVKEKLRE